MKNQELVELSKHELLEITGGSWAYDLGHWIGDRMCDISEVMTAMYNFSSCGYWNTEC